MIAEGCLRRAFAIFGEHLAGYPSLPPRPRASILPKCGWKSHCVTQMSADVTNACRKFSDPSPASFLRRRCWPRSLASERPLWFWVHAQLCAALTAPTKTLNSEHIQVIFSWSCTFGLFRFKRQPVRLRYHVVWCGAKFKWNYLQGRGEHGKHKSYFESFYPRIRPGGTIRLCIFHMIFISIIEVIRVLKSATTGSPQELCSPFTQWPHSAKAYLVSCSANYIQQCPYGCAASL